MSVDPERPSDTHLPGVWGGRDLPLVIGKIVLSVDFQFPLFTGNLTCLYPSNVRGSVSFRHRVGPGTVLGDWGFRLVTCLPL